jgi:hypothetical protein
MTDNTARGATASEPSIDRRVTELINRYSVIGGVIVGLIGAAWTIHAWDEVAVRESQKPFLEKQLQYYVEASKVAAKLAILPLQSPAGAAPEETWEWAKQRFWELHWGELLIVGDKGVGAAMARFGQQVGEVEKCRRRAEDCPEAQARLKPLSLELSRAIRASLARAWDYNLPGPDAR